MTNAELIAKIKAEIERIASRAMNEEGQDICKYLLSFLSAIESEKPMNPDELEEEMDRFFETMPVLEHENIFDVTFQNIARHFAQWGAEWQKEQDKETIELAEDHAYFAGSVNEREKMMEGAVEGVVMDFSSKQPRPQVDVLLDPHKYHTGDKVRIIILKED